MRFAIIAAGEGQRMVEGGVNTPKPMMVLRGEPLVGRLLRIFSSYHPTEIVLICRSTHTDVIRYLERWQEECLRGDDIPLRFVKAITPSSMHSLEAISGYLADEPFLLTTVDTVFREDEFRAFMDSLEGMPECIDGCFAVTDFVDDEKPLYVQTDDNRMITGFYDENGASLCKYVSGGIYVMRPECLEILHQCVVKGEQHMRNFQRSLIKAGKQVMAYPFMKIIDVDHPSDLLTAAHFLEEQ